MLKSIDFNVNAGISESGDTTNVELSVLYLSDKLSDKEVMNCITENIDKILDSDQSSIPDSILVVDKYNLDKIVRFILSVVDNSQSSLNLDLT